ncbi:related to protein involved in sporulation and meiosis [Cephalotrichum gorgonifer]|uniref:Related to protein involved in sporulation and meiosis n=1 Tax=Cephalotrichum gorgonifer TaxID=2041049 RepID=A0AAE8N8E0_9PEZI|nr:related to protein involved in sporulation and meiosis [Cephalotrichum gorgonifer]
MSTYSSSSAPSKSTKMNLAIQNLISPPEPKPLENFYPSDAAAPSSSKTPEAEGREGKTALPPSPPDTPQDAINNDIHTVMESARDPILFDASQESSSASATVPLFPPESNMVEQLVDQHVRRRKEGMCETTYIPGPTKDDYGIVVGFTIKMMEPYIKDRRGWLKRERAWAQQATKARLERKRAMQEQRRLAVTAPKPVKHAAILPAKSSPVVRNEIQAKPTAARVGSPPEPQRRIVAPNREDKDFNALRDYCPPLSSLPNKPNSLKVEWKGQPIDLSGDPNSGLLHPDEITLAANLRLDCATYLTSKRRIFIQRLECAKIKKPFRKTDAQQACKIDVNKASKLWTAFEKVGWLDDHWIRRFM